MFKHHTLKTILWAVVISVGYFTAASAAESENDPARTKKNYEAQLDKVVVTATRTAKDLESAPGSVSAISREEIESRNIRTVDEALNMTPGVTVTRSKGYMDTHAPVYMRGFNSQPRSLVLLDGVVLNDPYSGAVLWQVIAPENLEQIEVLKGPASSLYGGNAMGGVINLITRMPKKREFIVKGGYGGPLGGSDAMKNVSKAFVSYGDRIADRLSILASNQYISTTGYANAYNVQSTKPGAAITGWEYTTDRMGKPRYLIGMKGDNGYWHDNISIKTQYDLAPATRIDFNFTRTQSEYSYADPTTFLRDANGQEVWKYGTVREASFLSGSGGDLQYTYNLGVETQWSPVKLKGLFSYFDQGHSWYITPDSTGATRDGGKGKYSDAPSSAYSIDLQGSVPFFDRHLLTIGGYFRSGQAHIKEYEMSTWRSEASRGGITYETQGKDRTFALFAQCEFALMNNLTFYAGARQDWWETFDGSVNQESPVLRINYDSRSYASFSPKGSVVYKPFTQTTVKVSGGKAFRSPTLYDLYRTVQDHGGKMTQSNPDLKPETTLSWDAGITQGLWPGATVKVTYFENFIEDLIYTKTIDAATTQKINAGKAESRGVELEAEQKIGSWLRLFANYTYTDAVIKENSAAPDSIGKKVTGIPQHMINIGSEVKTGQFSGLLTGRYVGKRYGVDDNSDTTSNVYTSYDDYFTADAKVSYKLTKWLTASLSVDNILDRTFYLYYKAPGRSWFGELTFYF